MAEARVKGEVGWQVTEGTGDVVGRVREMREVATEIVLNV